MPFELNRNAQFHIITSAGILTGTFADSAGVTAAMLANCIPGITDFGYDHELGVERKGEGQFGVNKPIDLTDSYKGIKGTFTAEGSEGEKAVLAALAGVARSSFVNAVYNKMRKAYLVANITDDDGSPLNAHFCDTVKIEMASKAIGGDQAHKYPFQGIWGQDFPGHKLRYFVMNGNATPVTALTFPTGETPVAWLDENKASRYALLVLRFAGATSTDKRLLYATAAAAGYYSETSTAVTLATGDGLAATDKALVVYPV